MNILITGAGGGMGLAACRLLSQAGHAVYGLDLQAPEDTPMRFRRTDLTDEAAVSAAAAEYAAQGVRFDAIIHHAGIYDLGSLVELPQARVQKIFEVNLFAAMRVDRLFLPLLNSGARIILTSSELAPLDPLPFTGIYAVTKAAVEKYAYSLRMELQLLGHSVTVLRPGAVQTKLLGVSTARLDEFCEQTALFSCNADRFRKIVNTVEARSVPPEKIAALDLKILRSRRPRYVYKCNRNPGLLLLNALPRRLQTAIIRRILK